MKQDSEPPAAAFPETAETSDEPDFEYHVEFPKVVEGDRRSRGEGQIEPDLVVVLLGWAGSTHKYLSKYSDIYLDRGCTVLRYIAPLRTLFIDTDRLPVISSKLLQVLHDLQLDQQPTFFHVFSNGGAFTYSYILREIQESLRLDQLNLCGSIFDSAPAPRDMRTCYKALKSIYMGWGPAWWWGLPQVLASLSVLLIICSVFWYHLKTALKFCLFGDATHVVGPGGLIRRRPEEAPPTQNWLCGFSQLKGHSFLFLYSDRDELIEAERVQEFAAGLKPGNRVVMKNFMDSEHVQHYRKYPDEYVEAVTEFIGDVMKDYGKRAE